MVWRHHPHLFHTSGGTELPGYAYRGVAGAFCGATSVAFCSVCAGTFRGRVLLKKGASLLLLSLLPLLLPLLLRLSNHHTDITTSLFTSLYGRFTPQPPFFPLPLLLLFFTYSSSSYYYYSISSITTRVTLQLPFLVFHYHYYYFIRSILSLPFDKFHVILLKYGHLLC